MTHTYSKLLFHLVWSTKNRQKFIDQTIKNRIYTYIRGIVENKQCILIVINGMPDHVHLLINTPLTVGISDLVKIIKINSTKWIRSEFPQLNEFSWQEGYGAFSVGFSNEQDVKQYIINQEEHHKVISFEEEYLNFLNKLGIAYDKRFVLG